MRKLKDYSAKDWLRLRPLLHGGKQLRNDFVQSAFLRLRPDRLEKFLEDNGHLAGKSIVQIIAYEQPEVLNLSIRMARRHLANTVLLVFDNSPLPEAQIEIERVCREHNVAYLALPANPTRHPNRSHGLAMTWVWHHVVKSIRPAVAGFIDHDLIPLERIELNQVLAGQPFYGVPIVGPWGWSLWAGYCLFDFPAVSSLPLNFLNDFSRNLDTGGRNWKCLYSRHNAHQLRFARWQLFDVPDVSTNGIRRLELIDESWIHIAGVSYRDDYRRNSDFYGRLARAVEAGADWWQLQAALGGPEKIHPTSQEVIAKSDRPRWRMHHF
jgi:hypothetical protein